jgi:hypothetical protein
MIQSVRERIKKYGMVFPRKREYLFFPAVISAAFMLSCGVPSVKADKPFDFTTQGFIDDNHFQVIVSEKPDKAAKGLVAQRDSALTIARNGIQKKAVTDLAQYRMGIYIHEKGIDPTTDDGRLTLVKKDLTAAFLPLLSYGRVIEEYYEKDNSAVILFRIEKSGLRQEVSSSKIAEPR